MTFESKVLTEVKLINTVGILLRKNGMECQKENLKILVGNLNRFLYIFQVGLKTIVKRDSSYG